MSLPKLPDLPDDPSPTIPMPAWGDYETTLRERRPGDDVEPSGWALVVYAGAALGRVFGLHPGDNLVGRTPNVHIPLVDDEVSRNHAVVRLLERDGHEAHILLEDLGSTNGTLVNGRALRGTVELAVGDRVAFGRHVLKLVAMDALERAFHQTLLDQSTRDPLTGLGNRASTLMDLQNRFELSRRHERPLSVVMVDLDHFKRINDQFGHGAGDATLQQFGELVRQQLRSSDLAGRIGGEEFLLVLPETELAGAALLAQRLREAVASTPVPLPDGPLTVTASFGVAERSPRDREAGDLMGRADASLYRAKHLGRNRIELAGGGS